MKGTGPEGCRHLGSEGASQPHFPDPCVPVPSWVALSWGHPAVPKPSPITLHPILVSPPAAQPPRRGCKLHGTDPSWGPCLQRVLTAFALVVLVRVVDLENRRRKPYEDLAAAGKAPLTHLVAPRWWQLWEQLPRPHQPGPRASTGVTSRMPRLKQILKKRERKWDRIGGNGN